MPLPMIEERYHMSKVGSAFSEKLLRHATDTVIIYPNIADSDCLTSYASIVSYNLRISL